MPSIARTRLPVVSTRKPGGRRACRSAKAASPAAPSGRRTSMRLMRPDMASSSCAAAMSISIKPDRSRSVPLSVRTPATVTVP